MLLTRPLLDINKKWETLLGYSAIFASLHFARTMQAE